MCLIYDLDQVGVLVLCLTWVNIYDHTLHFKCWKPNSNRTRIGQNMDSSWSSDVVAHYEEVYEERGQVVLGLITVAPPSPPYCPPQPPLSHTLDVRMVRRVTLPLRRCGYRRGSLFVALGRATEGSWSWNYVDEEDCTSTMPRRASPTSVPARLVVNSWSITIVFQLVYEVGFFLFALVNPSRIPTVGSPHRGANTWRELCCRSASMFLLELILNYALLNIMGSSK